MFEDSEYHRRRTELELEKAVSAESIESAQAHLELARMHRARRRLIAKSRLGRIERPSLICGTDKEA